MRNEDVVSMKKLAIIGAAYYQRPLYHKAKEMGLYVIGFAWADGAVCRDVPDKFYEISVTEKEQILDICRQEQIDGICTIASDVAAPTVAYVAEKMGLIGNSYECALRANNKYRMRQVFSKADVPCPEYLCINDLSDIKKQISDVKHSFPLIVKPTDRSGSLGVMKVEKADDLLPAIKTAQEYSFKHEAIVEQFVEGKEISVEFISYHGVHYPLQITDKVTTEAPHFVELEHHQPADLTASQYKEIYSVTRRALNALGVTNGASHSEYRITKDGKIYVMEIGARMGGDFIGAALVRLSTGYDFVKGVIDVALGEFNEPVFGEQKHSGVLYVSEETKQLMPILEHWQNYPELVTGEITRPGLRPITCSADRTGYVVYQADCRLDASFFETQKNGEK